MNALVLSLALVGLAAANPTPDLLDIHAGAPAAKPIAIKLDDVVWKAAPPRLPPGAQAAVLEGDPTRPGIVTMRLKMPKGYRLPMHTHPADERVTVMSGTARVTYVEPGVDTAGGAAAAQTSTRIFPAGSFYLTPKGVPHAVAVDEETIIQITVHGPWGLDYLDAKPAAKAGAHTPSLVP